ncbi:MAG: hypothetical protein IH609_11910 [Dehalococcoidia bacterium]|nr:hypothetical protein [Dehalococcoidia bacterium]
MAVNEVAAALGVRPLFEPEAVECHSWLPVHLEAGARLDYCAVCSRSLAEHPADAFEDEDVSDA